MSMISKLYLLALQIMSTTKLTLNIELPVNPPHNLVFTDLGCCFKLLWCTHIKSQEINLQITVPVAAAVTFQSLSKSDNISHLEDLSTTEIDNSEYDFNAAREQEAKDEILTGTTTGTSNLEAGMKHKNEAEDHDDRKCMKIFIK